MKNGRINERNIGNMTLDGELKIRKAKKVVLRELSDLQIKALDAIDEINKMLKFNEFRVYAPENYSETLNHWLKNGLAKIEEREPTAHSCGKNVFWAVFVGEKSHLELCKGLMIHTLNLKPYIDEN
jgi:hypothetical protein